MIKGAFLEQFIKNVSGRRGEAGKEGFGRGRRGFEMSGSETVTREELLEILAG